MTTFHSIHVDPAYALEMLQLDPSVMVLKHASIANGDLVILVESEEDLGASNLDALYGNKEEESSKIELGMLIART